jgi:hypothetical protein
MDIPVIAAMVWGWVFPFGFGRTTIMGDYHHSTHIQPQGENTTTNSTNTDTIENHRNYTDSKHAEINSSTINGDVNFHNDG